MQKRLIIRHNWLFVLLPRAWCMYCVFLSQGQSNDCILTSTHVKILLPAYPLISVGYYILTREDRWEEYRVQETVTIVRPTCVDKAQIAGPSRQQVSVLVVMMACSLDRHKYIVATTRSHGSTDCCQTSNGCKIGMRRSHFTKLNQEMYNVI